MKKLLSLILPIAMAATLTACQSADGTSSGSSAESTGSTTSQTSAPAESKADTTVENSAQPTAETSQPENDETSHGGKILIAYFSETGNTDKLAQIIHEQTGGELFRIEPVNPYPTGDALFDYTKSEQDNDERPEIAGTVENMEQYDTVFIGYPIWWYEVPQIIKTFLDEYDLSGKTVIPFNTHEGSRDGGTYRYIAEQEPEATVLDGLPIRGGDMQNDQTQTVREWLDRIGY